MNLNYNLRQLAFKISKYNNFYNLFITSKNKIYYVIEHKLELTDGERFWDKRIHVKRLA